MVFIPAALPRGCVHRGGPRKAESFSPLAVPNREYTSGQRHVSHGTQRWWSHGWRLRSGWWLFNNALNPTHFAVPRRVQGTRRATARARVSAGVRRIRRTPRKAEQKHGLPVRMGCHEGRQQPQEARRRFRRSDHRIWGSLEYSSPGSRPQPGRKAVSSSWHVTPASATCRSLCRATTSDPSHLRAAGEPKGAEEI